MKRNISFSDEYAVSEVVGGLLLILIALMVFSVIYLYVFPLPIPPAEPNVDLMGYVTDSGLAVLAHMGGNALSSYRIDISYLNGTLISSTSYENPDDTWKIGEYVFPLTDVYLLSENDMVRIIVYNIEGESQEAVFDGILRGKTGPPPSILFPSMLISSLLTNTVDEDLICFNYTIEPQIYASTYIYNWSVDGNPIMDMLFPFDTNSANTAKDYSGNSHDGTIVGPVWESNGVVGGSYQFDGTDDYISLPYCFDGSYIDDITVEAWIKTNASSGIIASFDRNDYWELAINYGCVRWSTTSGVVTVDIVGTISVNDDAWHHIVATYSASTGNSAIYVDGELDKYETEHGAGSELGSGSNPGGFIGTSISGDIQSIWETLTYDDFEENWFGNYTDGGRDCSLYEDGAYAHQGNNAANIQDNSGWESSFYYTNGIDVDIPEYVSIKVDFWFYADEMENGEDFWVRYYDGSDWITVADYDRGDEFVNDQFYHEIVWINETSHTFPSDMKIRFQCDASGDSDDIYIDQVYVNATTGVASTNNFSGLMDEFHIYDRTLSSQQVYQNYLCTKDGFSDKSVIVSEETSLGNIWRCMVTPNDSIQDDDAVMSNSLQIVSYGGG